VPLDPGEDFFRHMSRQPPLLTKQRHKTETHQEVKPRAGLIPAMNQNTPSGSFRCAISARTNYIRPTMPTTSRRRRAVRQTSPITGLPTWVAPQLSKPAETVPEGDQWAHEIKLDGYRMHARLDGGQARLLTRTGLDWTEKYPTTASALGAVNVQQAYIDGELCAVAKSGVPSLGLLQAATDNRQSGSLIFFAFDLLYLDGENLMPAPLADRKQRLEQLLEKHQTRIRYCDHQVGLGPQFFQSACKLGLEGVVSKRLDAPYVPGNRGLWLKTKCLNREEFIIAGWTDPEGTRPHLGALLLAYHDTDGRLTYAGRAGTGMSEKELERVWRRLQPLAARRMPLDVLPPRESRFGTPLELSRVHWVRPELVAEVTYLTWTLDNLLRQVAYVGLREDKPACDVQRPVPHPKIRG
jgi:bifunctional non-homologous end joining protein LigD